MDRVPTLTEDTSPFPQTDVQLEDALANGQVDKFVSGHELFEAFMRDQKRKEELREIRNRWFMRGVVVTLFAVFGVYALFRCVS